MFSNRFFMTKLSLILHDIRSAHNVGSILRTAECLGVEHVYFTGYTPYPAGWSGDERLPHIRDKLNKQIHKTALGAEDLMSWSVHGSVETLIGELKARVCQLVALEQSGSSIPLNEFKATGEVALLLGREVEGVDLGLLEQCDVIVEIPQVGQKESLNVAQAAAIAIYQILLT